MFSTCSVCSMQISKWASLEFVGSRCGSRWGVLTALYTSTVRCSVLQRDAVCGVAVCCGVGRGGVDCIGNACDTLQHTATHCNALQHTATHCDTLRHTATHCNTLRHTATHYRGVQHTVEDGKLVHYFSHESDVTSLQDPFTSRPYKTPFYFHYCVPRKIRRGILFQIHVEYSPSFRLLVSALALHTTAFRSVFPDTLQHTATHCNTLQHTAIHF